MNKDFVKCSDGLHCHMDSCPHKETHVHNEGFFCGERESYCSYISKNVSCVSCKARPTPETEELLEDLM